MKRILAWIMLLLLIIAAGCDMIGTQRSDAGSITSYKEIPGVTKEEVSAIEALKAQREGFSYGHMLETESFMLEDGAFAGFAIEVCKLLSGLFDTEFTPVYFDEWEQQKAGIDGLTLDFSGEFTATAERAKIYHMTVPIAGRTLKIFTLADSAEIDDVSDTNGLKMGFLSGTVTAGIIMDNYPGLSFDMVDVPSFSGAAGMLRSGEIDAFVVDGVVDPLFEAYDFIESKDFFSLVYTPVSITTANPDLAPVISVINKYLVAGGIDKLNELYEQGNRDYIKYKLYQSFTDEEKAWLENLKARGGKVNIGLQHDVYPVSFYNENDKEFQGIALDILGEISTLTDIDFDESMTSMDTPLSDYTGQAENGRDIHDDAIAVYGIKEKRLYLERGSLSYLQLCPAVKKRIAGPHGSPGLLQEGGDAQ